MRTFAVLVRAQLILAACLSVPAPGADDALPQPNPVLARERLDQPATLDEIAIDIDREVYRRIFDTGLAHISSFPVPGRPALELQLETFNLLSADARFVVVDATGPRELPPRPIRFFRGRVAGDPDSRVTLIFVEGRVAGSIRTWDNEYIVEPEDFNVARTPHGRIRVRERHDGTNGASFACDGTEPVTAEPQPQPFGLVAEDDGRTVGGLPARRRAATPAEMLAIDENTLLQGKLAIDATVEFYQHFASLTATQDYILNLMAQVSTIYETEVKVKIEVGYLRVFTAELDPYTDGSTSTSVLLDDLRSEWTTNQGSIERAAAHLFSLRPSGGSGRAYVDALCSDNSGYGVSTISANGGSWEKELVAHEIGHNFSSRHTHCYSPEIDRCATASGCYEGSIVQTTGTIMSYCDQSQPVFHPRVRDEQIRPAAEAAYPGCIDTAGLPGEVQGGAGQGVLLSKPPSCPNAAQSNDDGSANSYFGYGGTTRMGWIKRFRPACYPFRLNSVDLMTGHSSVAPGRPVRLLVYTDPAATGNPGTATLVHSEDATVQVVSSATFNSYALDPPVVVSSGDYYVGFYDLLDDSQSTYIAAQDSSREGDSYRGAGSTSPDSFGLHTGGTWMIRAAGGAVASGSVTLGWNTACNEATTVGQDYAVYSGAIGDFENYSSLTCSTARATQYLSSDAGDAAFFLVVPATSANEGSYGRGVDNAERPSSATACKTQSFAACP